MIITIDEVAELLSANPADALLAMIVKAANNGFGREFTRATRTQIVRGWGVNYIFLPESPIISVSEVRIDPIGDLGADTVIEDLTQFKWGTDPEDNRLFYIGGTFPDSSRAVQISYLAGYYPSTDGDVTHVPKMPEDLRLAVLDEISERHRRGTTGSELMKSETMGAYSYTRFDSMHPGRARVFNRYRR